MKRLRSALRQFIPMACAWSLAAGLEVLVQHQVLRLQADDPQVEWARDAARRIEGGADPASVLPANRVALERDQSPFISTYGSAGTVLASSATLRGAAPQLPAGVFEFARRNGEHRLSWQPQAGVREALVIVPVHSGSAAFVVAGRSLRETEARKSQVLRLALLAWLGGLVLCFVTASLIPDRPN